MVIFESVELRLVEPIVVAVLRTVHRVLVDCSIRCSKWVRDFVKSVHSTESNSYKKISQR